MSIVKEGIKISILFEAKLETGEIVLKTDEGRPLDVIVGEGTIPKSIENALINMKKGESKIINLEPHEAFGSRLKELIIDLPKEGFSPDAKLEVGERVSINSPNGKRYIGTILEVKRECILVDFNHPLAGKNLVFTVTISSIC